MSSLQLQDKVILITGALGVAGQAAIQLFLDKGATIAAIDIKEIESFPEIYSLTERYGTDRFTYMEADCTNEDQIRDVTKQIHSQFGRLNGYYHNAYYQPSRSIAEMSLHEWEHSLRGTLTSGFLICKYAAPYMIASGGGSIVNTSSIMSSRPRVNNAAYGSAKAGLEQLTRIIALEYSAYGIRANAIVPGDFKSTQQLADLGREHIDGMKIESLVGRSGHPNEINEVAAFLLSDLSSYVTGSIYPVNGGLWI
ncbi:dihydroanticapsin 7-dehydrogenase [Paenibacillus baekrokdamisoli]|uniref:Dihydroanticapsin 7-dehydrogenase n=1 Tax=Paenibacillus baekrokdamisoli TaxID=1712516 RepID=A0A3G9JEA1_9BACL|nr:SDR family oxidoreductase [Paenibacillus baekrokdamisoli]MBB3071787.1 NAD(P)-dependent dehydrogenase (short-subunit alcohol dehydrogenase family) [Paenibacillus baekrokdamisoli]BBH24231.1 dihydroanticapsin 7-dehydrogenase [Paenibacillus baekrokdamisoli]